MSYGVCYVGRKRADDELILGLMRKAVALMGGIVSRLRALRSLSIAPLGVPVPKCLIHARLAAR